MDKPIIRAIAAVGKNTNALGKNGGLLWHFSDDLKRFRKLTTGHPVIMGRKTYESIGKPLPNRTNIIITRNSAFSAPGCTVVHSLDEAIAEAKKLNTDIFIIGGGEIFKESLPLVDVLHLTLIDDETPGDVYFPDWKDFGKVISEEKGIDPKTGIKYVWVDVSRNRT